MIDSGQILLGPRSFVKELVENSLDAEGTEIRVDLYFKESKLVKIKVQDNGTGIHPSDFRFLGKRYCTSKIKEYNKFTKIDTLGFRGEAINAISLNSKLTIQSNQE